MGSGAAGAVGRFLNTGFVLDTSALLAPVFDESGDAFVIETLALGVPIAISSVNLAESLTVMSRRRDMPIDLAMQRIGRMHLTIVPFDADHAAAFARSSRCCAGEGFRWVMPRAWFWRAASHGRC